MRWRSVWRCRCWPSRKERAVTTSAILHRASPWLTGIGVALFLVAEVVFLASTTPAERAACDRAFSTLMEASSLVEFERSRYLLRKSNCSVARRFCEYGAP